MIYVSIFAIHRFKEWIESGLGVDRSAKEWEWEYMKESKYSASLVASQTGSGFVDHPMAPILWSVDIANGTSEGLLVRRWNPLRAATSWCSFFFGFI